jgi:hypothetical protein
MSAERDMALFAKSVNADLDKVINDMAESSKRIDAVEKDAAAAREETNALLGRVFERMGGIDDALKRVVPAVESFDRRLTLLQEAQINTQRDLAQRLHVVEARLQNVVPPAEEVTPRPAPYR